MLVCQVYDRYMGVNRGAGFASRLQEALQARGWSAYRLSQEADVTASAVSRWLAGNKGLRVDVDIIERVSDALGVSLAWLLSGRGDMSESGEAPADYPNRARAVRFARECKLPEQAIRDIQEVSDGDDRTPELWFDLIRQRSARLRYEDN